MIYLLLPAYNEENNILPLLRDTETEAQKVSLDLLPVVINDGSQDQTSQRVTQYQGSLSVTLLEHTSNQGLAAALFTGLTHILNQCGDEDILVTMDADNTHSPRYIPELIQQLHHGHDIVIASRFAPGGKEMGVNPFRKLLSHGARWVYHLAFPSIPIRDFSCGYRAFRASILKQTYHRWGNRLLEAPGFSCTGELMLKSLAFTSPERITEIPFELHYERKGGSSKMPTLDTILGTLSLIRNARQWITEGQESSRRNQA